MSTLPPIAAIAILFWPVVPTLAQRTRKDGASTRFSSPAEFMKPTFSIGIEEEYQTVDPETRDLRSHIQAEILERGRLILQERVKAEMHQSVVEVGTGVCKNIKEAKA